MTIPFFVDDAEEHRRVQNIMALPNSVFVFGSNLGGIHGAGAAKDAYHKYGAIPRLGIGIQGRSYAIPTKNASFDVLPLSEIGVYVRDFLNFASRHPETTFAVTRVGCGLSGFNDFEIAPLFRDGPVNCSLPKHWWDIIAGEQFSFEWDT